MSSRKEELKIGARLTLFFGVLHAFVFNYDRKSTIQEKDYPQLGEVNKKALILYIENFGAVTIIFLLVVLVLLV